MNVQKVIATYLCWCEKFVKVQEESLSNSCIFLQAICPNMSVAKYLNILCNVPIVNV